MYRQLICLNTFLAKILLKILELGKHTYIHTSLHYTNTLVTTQGTGDMGLVCKLGQQRRSDVTVTEREETEMVGNTK